MFSKANFFCALFLFSSVRFFSVFDENKERGKRNRKKACAHTQSAVDGEGGKKNRNNNINVSCAFSIHLYAMHFSKCFSQKKSTTLLKSIEQSFHIEVHFSFVRSLIRGIQHNSTNPLSWISNAINKRRIPNNKRIDTIYFCIHIACVYARVYNTSA